MQNSSKLGRPEKPVSRQIKAGYEGALSFSACYCPHPRPRSIDAQCRREGSTRTARRGRRGDAPQVPMPMHVRRHSRHRPKPAYPRNRSYTSGSTLEISQGCGEVCGLLRGGPDCARRSIALRASFFSPESSCLGTVLACNPPLTGLR